jgi:predicted RNA methylase
VVGKRRSRCGVAHEEDESRTTGSIPAFLGYVGMKYRKGIKSIAFRGPIRTLTMLIDSAASSLRAHGDRSEAEAVERAFDAEQGIDTSDELEPPKTKVVGANWIQGSKYEGVKKGRFVEAMSELRIPYEDYVFIDYGSGKGRAVFLAAGFPFKRVVGIEYCPELDAIARQNLQRYPEAGKVCKNIELVCMDALEYQLPDEPLVLFLNNPFGPKVMKQVVEKVEESFRHSPRGLAAVYFTAECANLWDRLGFLKRVTPSCTVSPLQRAFRRTTASITWIAEASDSTRRAQPYR